MASDDGGMQAESMAGAACKRAGDDDVSTQAELDTQLFVAALGGSAPEVARLLTQNADPDAFKADNGCTALVLASAHGHAAVVHALLAGRADTRAKTNDGRTALSYARANNHAQVVAMLEAAQRASSPGAAAVAAIASGTPTTAKRRCAAGAGGGAVAARQAALD